MNSTSVRQILREFFAENRPLLAGAILVLLANNFLNVLLPLSIGLFYQIVLHDEGGAKARLLAWLPLEIGSPGAFFGFFAALIALKTAFSWLERFWTGLVGERFSQNLRERTFAAQLAHTLESHRSRPVGKYLLRYSGDLTAVQNFLTKGILGFAGDAFFLLLAFAVLFSMRPLWAGAVAGLFAATAVAVAILSRFLRKKAVARRNLRSESMDFVSSRLQAFKTVKSFNRENRENRLFRRLSGRLFESAKDYLRLSALVQAVSPMFFFGTVAAVLWLVYQQVGQNPGSVRAGEVLVFVLMLLYLRGVMRRVLEANVVWQSGGASFEKLVRLLNLPAEPRGDVFKKNASPETKSSDAGEAAPAPTLRLENLAFGFGAAAPAVFENLDFEFPATGISLVRGEGKSTFLNLLLKFHEPTRGQIFLENIDYQKLTPFEVRRRMSLVSDETPLVGDTVFRAIAFRPDEDKREKAAAILKKLRLELAETEADALDLRLEEGGKNLAAGELVLLQFARALLTGKKILLLDDPFQRLDREKTRRTVRLLNRLKTSHCIVLAAETPPRKLELDAVFDLQKLEDE